MRFLRHQNHPLSIVNSHEPHRPHAHFLDSFIGDRVEEGIVPLSPYLVFALYYTDVLFVLLRGTEGDDDFVVFVKLKIARRCEIVVLKEKRSFAQVALVDHSLD